MSRTSARTFAASAAGAIALAIAATAPAAAEPPPWAPALGWRAKHHRVPVLVAPYYPPAHRAATVFVLPPPVYVVPAPVYAPPQALRLRPVGPGEWLGGVVGAAIGAELDRGRGG